MQGEESTESSSQETDEAGSSEENAGGSNILIAYFTAAENSGVDAEASASYSEVDGEAKGRMEALCLEVGQEYEIIPDENENFLAVYVREGKILSSDFTLSEKETFIQKEWRKSIIIKNPGPVSAKMGICRGLVDNK